NQIQITGTLDFTAHLGHVRSEPRGGNDSSMKITVRAFRLAERDLHVDAKAGHLHKNFNTAAHSAQSSVTMDSRWVGNYFCLQPPVTRSVKFTKEDSLPASELQL